MKATKGRNVQAGLYTHPTNKSSGTHNICCTYLLHPVSIGHTAYGYTSTLYVASMHHYVLSILHNVYGTNAIDIQHVTRSIYSMYDINISGWCLKLRAYINTVHKYITYMIYNRKAYYASIVCNSVAA